MRAYIRKMFFYSAWFITFSMKMFYYLIISIPLRFDSRYKNLWLIAERPDEARDNGYWLYEWILKNEPETNMRFVLTKDSPDYKKMKRKDLIVEPYSAEHYICWILSSYSISTHMHGACPGKSFCIPFLPFSRRKRTIFLQHGITKDKIKLRGHLDVIVASAEKEKDLLIESNQSYKNNVQIVGFCRYDNLNDISANNEKKIILVMPTFRRWLRDIARLKDGKDVFKNTDYYLRWNSFLNNQRLKKILERNNLEIVFFPHKEIQEMSETLTISTERIIIGKPGEFDIQTLLKKSSLLVTDYSSVFFDFVYMDKPVVFYQFDQKDFFTKHYQSSGKKYPFGNTVVDEEMLIEEIEKIVKRNFSIEKRFQNEACNFYKYRDKNNCYRNYHMIKEIK